MDDKHLYEECVMGDKVEKIAECATKKMEKMTFYKLLTVFTILIASAFGYSLNLNRVVADDLQIHRDKARVVYDGIKDKFNSIKGDDNLSTYMYNQMDEKLDTIIEQNKYHSVEMDDIRKRVEILEWENEHTE